MTDTTVEAPLSDPRQSMDLLVTNAPNAADVLRAALSMTWPANITPQERAAYNQAWAEAFVDRVITMPGTGSAILLDQLLTDHDVYFTDEVDDDPERNPRVGLVKAATSTWFVNQLLAWRAGHEPEPNPFAIHTIVVSDQRADGTWNYTITHGPDCDRLPYGETCAFDQVAQGEIPIAPGTTPGEYAAWVVLSGANGAVSDEYIYVDEKPITRVGQPEPVVPQFPGPGGTFWRDSEGDPWVTLPNGTLRTLHPGDANANEVQQHFGPMTRVGRDDL